MHVDIQLLTITTVVNVGNFSTLTTLCMGKGNFWVGTAGSHNRARLLRDTAAGGALWKALLAVPDSPMLTVKLMIPDHNAEAIVPNFTFSQ